MSSIQSSLGEIAFFVIVAVVFWGATLFILVPRLLHTGGQMDWPLRLFVATVGTLLAVGWSAVVLALFGQYTLGRTAVLLLAIGGGFTVYAYRRRPAIKPIAWGGWHELCLAALLVVAALLYLRPHEYVLGGSDAGSYINTAAATARTGAYLQYDEWNRFLSEYADVTFRTQPPQMRTRHLQFVGWYIDDDDPSLSRPQFFPFHPVMLSVAMSLGGVRAGFYVTPLVAVLSIAALYFLARQLFGRATALLAALFLTATSTQIFFARYPTTEPLTMLLLFTGFLAFQIIWDDSDAAAGWGIIGGASLGAAMLTRIDLPLVAAVLLAALVLRAWLRRWSRAWSVFTGTFLFFLLQLLLVGWLVSWPYVWNTYYAVYSLLNRSVWLAGAAVIGVVVMLIAAALSGTERFAAKIGEIEASKFLRWALAFIIVGLSVYAYFLRPILEPTRMATSWPGGVQFPILNGQNWVRLGWYLTPLGIGLATAGVAMIVVRERLTRLAVVVGIGVLTTFQYVYNIMNTPYHIYAMRRYVPIIIPMLWMFAAYAIVALPRLPRRWMTYTLRTFLIAALVGGMIYQDRYVLPARDFAGSLQQLDELQQLLHPAAIVLIAEPSEALFADAFGAPLQSMFARPIATIRANPTTNEQAPSAPDEAQAEQIVRFLEKLLSDDAAEGRPVQLMAAEPIPLHVRRHLRLQPHAAYNFTTQMLMNTYDSFPSVTQTVHYGIEIYDVVADNVRAFVGDVVEIDIGLFDAAYLDSGFYGKEYIPGAPTMRWTTGAARLTAPLPSIAAPMNETDAHELEIHVRAMIYRPATVEPSPVMVNVNGRSVGSFVPDAQWETYVFPLSDVDVQTDAVQIEFVTDPFVPAELGVNNDQRSLGFLIDWIKIMPQALGSSH